MFEVGKKYRICLNIGENETTLFGVIDEYEHPLIKLDDGRIINVTSSCFISAEPRETDSSNLEIKFV